MSRAIFTVTVKGLQAEAIKRVGRKLRYDELYRAKKGIEDGLSFDIDTVMKTAIEEAVKRG
jgi:hypothetical protein